MVLAPNGDEPVPAMAVRGSVSIQGRARSIFTRLWIAADALLTRETGF